MKNKAKLISIILSFILLIISIYCIFETVDVKADNIKKTNTSNSIYVDVKGAVNEPGVYEMKSNSRVIDAIIKAGDLRDDADTSILNLSKELKDEMYIIVYTKEEIDSFKDKIIPSKKIIKEIEQKIICPDTDNDACITKNDKSNNDDIGIININTASIDELKTLPSIGESKAKNIIEYREDNPFEVIEDIKNVKGIGNSLFEKIKDYITV